MRGGFKNIKRDRKLKICNNFLIFLRHDTYCAKYYCKCRVILNELIDVFWGYLTVLGINDSFNANIKSQENNKIKTFELYRQYQYNFKVFLCKQFDWLCSASLYQELIFINFILKFVIVHPDIH